MGKLLVQYVPSWARYAGGCFVVQMRRCQEKEGGDLVVYVHTISGQFRVVSLNIRQPLFSFFFFLRGRDHFFLGRSFEL